MLHIRILPVGSLKEKFFTDAVAEYAKRLTKYCKFEIIEIKESTPQKESEEIRTKLKGHIILCDIKGTQFTSQELATKISTLTQTTSIITLIIGGSHGVGNYLDDIVNEKISFGLVTLPHQLFRVILVEQIYRAFTILKGEKYHK